MKSLRILWSYMANNRLLYLGAILSVALAALANISGPLVIRITIDSIIGDEPVAAPPLIRSFVENIGQRFWVPGIVLIAITVFRGLFMFLRGRLSAQASENIAKNLRDRIYDHIQRLPYKYHKEADTGDLMQRCTSDIDTIRRFLGVQLVEVGSCLSLVLLITVIMVRADLRMALISMAVVPILFTFALVFFRKVKKAFKEADETEAQLTSVLQENLTGIRVVRAFHNQEYEIKRFTAKNEVHRDNVYHLIWLLAVYWSSSDFIAFFQMGVVLVAGAFFASRGEITIGTLVLFTSYTGMLLWPVRQLGRILTDMGKALVSAERLQEVFNQPREVLEENHKKPVIQGNIVFDNVSFSYEPGHPVLKNVSFTILPGQTVGILGHTGSGKSSLVQLLARLYDYEQGSIKIDGVELKDIDKRWIRRHVAVVPQEAFLFAKTIKENITLASGAVSDDELYAICQEAAIHDVILSFEKGYDTLVGERGISLSGGQKQRVAIARALITHSPILIFDDSLSAVDTETELAIRNALRKRAQKATTFLISHRVSSLSSADLILVLEDGEIVERGTHTELMAQNGTYRRIWDIQNRLEAELLLQKVGD
ncbi:MAG TPA: ABC transporter ATP-binding protein [Firmicutes bacterium]|jgi:ATP-binding cassette subfamily B protein|nr:ABC transporter ATP-binding protein [Bacillota bacterium]